MLNRYLGNKTDLLDPIMTVIEQRYRPGAKVCDIFAGTLSVSLALKRRGYSVIANDINYFSSIIGDAFVVNNAVPSVDLAELLPNAITPSLREAGNKWALSLKDMPRYTFLANQKHWGAYVDFLALLLYLQNLRLGDLPPECQRTHFFDTYSEDGRNSEFVSQRGRRGRRRFFSGSNAHQIDVILNQLRFWRRNQLVSHSAYAALLCMLLRAVEKVSNTQGTYHDFPREEMDPRALNPLRFEAPPFDVTLVGGEHIVGREEDSLEFIRRAPAHDLLYIDPPYNFRQYTAYYFMPNLICRYADIDDLDSYFARIEYVRGQNMDDDFVSTFCKKSQFIDSLATLIQRANTQTVVLSYFDGRNHWNEFKAEGNGVGHKKLVEFFNTDLFKPQSLEIVPILRTNYQSYGGYKAREVMEYVFIAEKAGS